MHKYASIDDYDLRGHEFPRGAVLDHAPEDAEQQRCDLLGKPIPVAPGQVKVDF
jgi:hypothetical protein